MRLALAMALLSTPALADERWLTDHGDAFYEVDIAGAAVFHLEDDGTGRAVRLILGGDLAAPRGVHAGVWIATSGAQPCTVAMVDPVEGTLSPHWGRVTLRFDEPGYPSGWKAELGPCLEPEDRVISATAITAR